jgi:hypothetical protein
MDRLPLLVVVSALTASVPPHSFADSQVRPNDAQVSWDDCSSSSRAKLDLSPSCGSNKGPIRLVVSFQPRDTVKGFVGCRAGISFWFQNQSVPSWWQFGAGACRSGAIKVISPEALSGHCGNPYLGGEVKHQIALPALYNGQQMNNTIVETSLQSPDGGVAHIDLPPRPSSGYVAFVLEIDGGDEACEGCEIPACITVHPLDVHTKNGLWARYYPESIVTWQRGAQCGAVSARPYTWGQIKALYR